MAALVRVRVLQTSDTVGAFDVLSLPARSELGATYDVQEVGAMQGHRLDVLDAQLGFFADGLHPGIS